MTKIKKALKMTVRYLRPYLSRCELCSGMGNLYRIVWCKGARMGYSDVVACSRKHAREIFDAEDTLGD